MNLPYKLEKIKVTPPSEKWSALAVVENLTALQKLIKGNDLVKIKLKIEQTVMVLTFSQIKMRIKSA